MRLCLQINGLLNEKQKLEKKISHSYLYNSNEQKKMVTKTMAASLCVCVCEYVRKNISLNYRIFSPSNYTIHKKMPCNDSMKCKMENMHRTNE